MSRHRWTRFLVRLGSLCCATSFGCYGGNPSFVEAPRGMERSAADNVEPPAYVQLASGEAEGGDERDGLLVAKSQSKVASAAPAPAGTTPRPKVSLPQGPFVAGHPMAARCLAIDGKAERSAPVRWRLEPLDVETAPSRLSTLPGGGPKRPLPSLKHVDEALVVERAGDYALVCAQQDRVGAWGESAPQHVTVKADQAVDWRVRLHRQGRCFHEGRRLPLSFRAWDRFGNTVAPIDLQFATSPAVHVARDDSGGLLFQREGDYNLTLMGIGPSGEQLPPVTSHVTIDSTAPTIELLSPARASMQLSSDYNVVLVGRVRDRLSAIASFEVERRPAVLQPAPNLAGQGHEYTFAVPFQARWGLNVVHAKAIDACGNTSLLVHSFYQSDDFAVPLREPPEADKQATIGDALPHAAQATLAQALWDQRDRDSGQDLRHLIEVAIINGGLNERLPSHLAHVQRLATDVYRDGPLTMAPPVVESLDIVDGGFEVRLLLRRLHQPITTRSWPTGSWFQLRAALTAQEVALDARAQVTMGPSGPVVSICDGCVIATFSPGDPKLAVRRSDAVTPAWQRLTAPITDYLLSFGQGYLVDALTHRVQQDIVRELTSVLRGLKLQHAIDAPAPLRGRLSLQSGLDEIHFVEEQEGAVCLLSLSSQVQVPLAQTILPPGLPSRYAAPSCGPIRGWAKGKTSASATDPQGTSLPGDLPGPSLARASGDTFALSISDNLLNQMFWSLWAAGSLHSPDFQASPANDSELAGGESSEVAEHAAGNLLDAARFKVYFLAPPVVMPSEHPDEIRIGVGDIYAKVEVDTYSVFGAESPSGAERLSESLFCSIAMRAKLGVDNERRSLKIVSLEASHAEVQVIDTNSPPMLMGVTHWLEKMLRLSMPTHLARALVNVPLPNLQIGRLPGMPTQAAWALEDVSLSRLPGAQETILRGRFGALPNSAKGAPTP